MPSTTSCVHTASVYRGKLRIKHNHLSLISAIMVGNWWMKNLCPIVFSSCHTSKIAGCGELSVWHTRKSPQLKQFQMSKSWSNLHHLLFVRGWRGNVTRMMDVVCWLQNSDLVTLVMIVLMTCHKNSWEDYVVQEGWLSNLIGFWSAAILNFLNKCGI